MRVLQLDYPSLPPYFRLNGCVCVCVGGGVGGTLTENACVRACMADCGAASLWCGHTDTLADSHAHRPRMGSTLVESSRYFCLCWHFCMYVCLCFCVCICVSVYVGAVYYLSTCACMSMCMCIRVCACVYMCMHVSLSHVSLSLSPTYICIYV